MRILFLCIAALLANCVDTPAPSVVPERFQGHWESASVAAGRVSGDLDVFNDRIELSHMSFPMTFVRRVSDQEVKTAVDFGIWEDDLEKDTVLLSVHVPANVRLPSGFSLCGDQDARWMLLIYSGAQFFEMIAFSGETPPDLTVSVATNRSLCDAFEYLAGKS